MTLSAKQALEVMAWADGELEGAEAARVEAFVLGSAEAEELARSVGALGDFVRASAAAPDVDVAAEVMRRAFPSDLERARLKRGVRARVAAAAATLAALAAGFVLYHRAHPPQTARVEAPSQAAARGVQIDEVDPSEHAVSVFYVSPDEGSKDPATTVVWIDDEPPQAPE